VRSDRAGGVGLLGQNWVWILAFFVAVFFYVWLVIEPRFQYHSFSPIFFTSSQFFQDHLSYPGGLIDYTASFILQFFRFSWLGAFLTTALAATLYLATRFLLIRVGWVTTTIVPLIPSALLVLVQSEYRVSCSPRVIGVVAAVSLAAAFVLSSKDSCWRGILFLALCWPIYLALGGVFLLFAFICILYETFAAKRWILSGSILAAAFLLPWVSARHVFVLSLRDAYLYLVPFTGSMPGSWALKSLFLTVPLLMFVAVFRQYFLSATQTSPVAPSTESPGLRPGLETKASRRTSATRSIKRPGPRISLKSRVAEVLCGERLQWVSHPGLWLTVFASLIAFDYSASAKLLARIDYSAEQRDWPQVIKLGRNLHSPTPAAVHDINRALAHSGMLLDRMFEFPQRREWELWFNLNHSMDMNKLLKSSELLLEHGHVNRAERMAAESLELNGYSPETLQQLFLISVLKEQPKTGLPFLNLLSQTLWHRNWAEFYQRALEADPVLSNDVGLQKIRPLMVRQDYVGAIPDNVLMQISLRQNPENRLSFQYLMAFYLLSGQLEKLGQNLERVRTFPLPVLPRHLQEAIVLFEKSNPGAQLDLHGLAINPAIEERYQRFNEAAVRCTAETAPSLLAKEFGDSYWYYSIAGHSGSIIPKGGMPK
jgi:hypothetical protein